MNKPAIDILSTYKKAQGRSILFGHILICFMGMSVGAAFTFFGARLSNGWNGAYLIWASLLLSAEKIVTRAHVKEMEMREKVVFHLSEWVAFAVALKILLYIVHNPSQLLTDLPLWQQNFVENFFTREYVVVLLVLFLVWLLAGAYAGELEDLCGKEDDAAWDELGKLQNALHDIRRRISTRVFAMGALVVLLSIFTRLDLAIVLRPLDISNNFQAPVINAVVYFFLAMLLLSQTQFAMLRTRWLWQRLPISTRLATNWLKYGLIAFLVLVVIVLFLPTRYSLGLLDTLRIVFDFLTRVFSFLILLVTIPFTLCLSLLSLFTRNSNAAATPAPAAASPVFPPTPAHPIAWLEFLRSLLFWGIFLAVIFFALRYYFSQNAELWKVIRNFPLIRWVTGAIKGIWNWIRGANRQVAALIQTGIQRLRLQRIPAPAQVVRRIFNLARMNPREKIIYFYLSLIELGGERGIERKPAMTPYQYERQVTRSIPEIDPDLHGLTDTFLEARYSQHNIDQGESDQAGSLWERIKAAIKNWKRGED